MPILFSPIDQSEMVGPFKPYPRTAFVMRQIGGEISDADNALIKETMAALKRAHFKAITAADVSGTKDFLQKIIDLIRGCGFGVAIFSDKTPAKALANIFFEVGIASVLGKPVQLVMTGENPAPSDLVRTEWISYKTNEVKKLRADLKKSLDTIKETASFYRQIGDVALESVVCDHELAFERYRQAILITDDAVARRRVLSIKERLSENGTQVEDMASHRSKLSRSVSEFLALLPSSPRRPRPRSTA